MSTASDLERQMLALINAERTSRGLNPVQLELRLNESAEDHSDWMLRTDNFSHTGSGGSSAGDRMRDAGFQFSGSWTWAENIAWQSIRGAPGLSDDVQNLHNSLMNSPGHRANILNENVTVIGIGIETGNFDGWDAIIVTQNFARTSAPLRLDTGGSGGGSGGGTPPPPNPSEPPDSSDPIEIIVSGNRTGTDDDDWLVLRKGAAGRLVGLEGDDILTGSSKADKLYGSEGNDTLTGKAGNDKLRSGHGDDRASGNSGHDNIKGGAGNDRLYGGDGEDELYGNDGEDVIYGGRHDDRIKGGGDADTLSGSSGHDNLWGQDGDDTLNGGDGRDRLSGGSGNDVLTGGNSADQFVFSTGTDRITDFGGSDSIDLRKVDAISSFNDLRDNHMYESGDNVVINDGLGNFLIVEDTSLSDLDRGDFIL